MSLDVKILYSKVSFIETFDLAMRSLYGQPNLPDMSQNYEICV